MAAPVEIQPSRPQRLHHGRPVRRPEAGFRPNGDRRRRIKPTGKKYFLDGVCHRMPLSERWNGSKALAQMVARIAAFRSSKVGWGALRAPEPTASISWRRCARNRFSFEINEVNLGAGAASATSRSVRNERQPEPDVSSAASICRRPAQERSEGDGT